MDGTIILNQRWLGQECRNVIVVSNLQEDVSFLQDTADSIRAAFNMDYGAGAVWVQNLDNAWELYSTTFSFNEAGGPPTYSIEMPFTLGPISGNQATTTPMATQTAMLISLGATAPPPNRGRIYLPGITSASMTQEGTWQSSALNRARALWENWAVNGLNGTFLRVSRRDEAGRIITTRAVDSVIAQPVPATIRRRRLGQGI